MERHEVWAFRPQKYKINKSPTKPATKTHKEHSQVLEKNSKTRYIKMGKCQRKLHTVRASDIHKYIIQPCHLLALCKTIFKSATMLPYKPQSAVENMQKYTDISIKTYLVLSRTLKVISYLP